MSGLVCVLLALSLSFSETAPNVNHKEPTLEEVLSKWEEATSNIKTIEMRFHRWVYHHTFEVEKRSTGTFFYEAPNRGRLEIREAEASQSAVSKKKNQQGESYKFLPEQPETWIWTGTKILWIKEKNRSYTSWLIQDTKESSNLDWISLAVMQNMPKPQNALPAIVDGSSKDLKQNFDIKLLKITDEHIWLELLPRESAVREQFKRIRIILDSETYQTTAAQYLDPAGTTETVYSFSDLKLNSPKPLNDKRLKPDLNGYQGEQFPKPVKALKPRPLPVAAVVGVVSIGGNCLRLVFQPRLCFGHYLLFFIQRQLSNEHPAP